MSITHEPNARKPLRLWPGVVAAVLLLLVKFVVPFVVPAAGGIAMLGGLAGGLAIIVWWLFFSRAPWAERAGAIVLMIVALAATSRVVHESIANGMMGMMLPIYAFPVLSVALVVWAVGGRRLSTGPRRVSLVASILVACGLFTLIRTGGVTGDADSDLHWRWTPTPEERLLAEAGDEVVPASPFRQARGRPAPLPTPAAPEIPEGPVAANPADKPSTLPEAAAPPKIARARPAATDTPAEWPGFRGPGRDSIVRRVRIDTDWSASPPVEMWRRPIGPGWSSFAVRGDFFYTQEQRGDDEIVACYKVSTGEPVWRHRDRVRFWESNAGPGPRGTPTVHDSRVYALGATGIVNALDAATGAIVWSRNAATDTGAELPGWGFAGSPLVVDDAVIIAASGRLAAYDLATGKPHWFRRTTGGGYSSPHLVTMDGVPQILLLSGGGATSVAPADGRMLWEHELEPGTSILQPALTADGDVLVTAGGGMGGLGMRRIAVARDKPAAWTVEERWTSRGLKPYFNDFVVHEGHAFGFDGSILACIDLADGKRKWKGGRYGHGQLILLPDQNVLLVLSEEGELALVRAAGDQFTELTRFQALEGKTWNHPVLVGDVLLVRNGEEMAAFRLTLASR